METVTDLTELTQELAGLRDLFLRRLLNDKVQQAAVDELAKRLDAADRRAAGAMLTPVLRQLVLVLDRIGEPQDDRLAAVRDELVEILTRSGVSRLESTVGLLFDPVHHHAVARVEVPDPAGENVIVAEHRSGYLIDGVLLRPAEVTVGSSPLATIDPRGEAGAGEENTVGGEQGDGAKPEVP
ncbi:nucleotide exchange factor GrpE [Kribbella sp. NPDC026611]|uniref:nucleotide exchange factor GrpE n=1 Tax=Kribbella sp. NPDC026611 TaxID=3154911 RepID=UPI0033EB5D99